ncbi:MAG: hypothetical protein WDZ88_01160 [Candidatus Paceibacterota bacterium]
MTFFFSRHKHEEVSLVFDIASGSVGASLVVISPKARPHTVYTYRAPIPFKDYKNFADFYSAMKECLSHVLDMLTKEGLPHLNFLTIRNKKIEHVLVLFASPWFISQTRRIHFEKKEEFELQPDILSEITSKEIEDFLLEGSRKKVIDKEDTLSVIDQATVQIKLNGYEVSEPFNKKAKTLDTAIFLSVISIKIKKDVTRAIESVFGVREINFHSFPLACFTALRDNFVTSKDFVVADMSGEVTDVSIIRDGVLKEVFSAPVGKNVLIRDISNQFTTVSDEALSMLSLYVNDSLDEKSRVKVEEVLARAVEKLKTFFSSIITSVESSANMPKQVFLLADKQAYEWFSHFLAVKDNEQVTFNNEKFRISFVREQTLYPFMRYGDTVKRDVFLTLGGLFLDRIAHESLNPQKTVE